MSVSAPLKIDKRGSEEILKEMKDLVPFYTREWDVTEDVQDFIDGLQVNCGWKVTDENYWGWFDIPQAFFRTKEFSYSLGPCLEFHGNNIPNLPPTPPLIIGTASGKPGESYVYSIVSNDPEGSELYYFVDWDDENNSGWRGPYDSGKVATISHTWGEKGTYEVKAKAKDILGEESPWGYLEVTMPMNQQMWFLRWFERFPILQKILDVLRLNIG